jgi:YHS domain-containing protein
MKVVFSSRKRGVGKSEPEELVQDPYCQTYIPKKIALKKRVAGRNYYFCNKECLKRFLDGEKSYQGFKGQ